MNASSVLRKLKDLDQLETRVKAMVNPSPKMLQEIEQERKALLEGKGTQEKIK